jgi:hypothetical protein
VVKLHGLGDIVKFDGKTSHTDADTDVPEPRNETELLYEFDVAVPATTDATASGQRVLLLASSSEQPVSRADERDSAFLDSFTACAVVREPPRAVSNGERVARHS